MTKEEYRFSVPCDLCISIVGNSEEEARERLRNALAAFCDGYDIPDEHINHDGTLADIATDVRLYSHDGDAEEAEVMDWRELT